MPQSSGVAYSGEAFGSSARVADHVTAGKSFPVNLGSCGTLRPPVVRANSGAAVNGGPAVITGAINTTASATEDSGTRTSRSTATAQGVRVLGGLIAADEVRAVSGTSLDGSGFHVDGAGTRLTRLVVAGVPIVVVPAPNTSIPLAGFGHVVVNEQIASVQGNSASLVVNMLHVVVTDSNPLVPVGTNIIVSHAQSRLALTNVAGTLDGIAYGSFVLVGQRVGSGRSATVLLGCNGTGGAVDTNSVATVDVQPAVATGNVTNTASGIVTSRSATAETTSTVEAANLLSSLVTVDAIHADAHAFTDGSTFTFTDTGSSFTNLSVRGFPVIDDSVPANTRIALQGLGALWLKHEIFTPNSIEVRMIEVIVTEPNSLGIPVGTDIRVAVAHASAH